MFFQSDMGTASAFVGNVTVEDNYSFSQQIFIERLSVPHTGLSARDRLMDKAHSFPQETKM